LASISVACCNRVTSLGAGLGAGRRRNTKSLQKRLKSFCARRKRFRSLKRVGVCIDRLIRTGGTAALEYGQAVMGVSPSMLLRQRRAVAASVVSSSAGGDLDLTLVLADGSARGRADPAYGAHEQPIVAWATAVWEKWLERGALLRLVADAKCRLTRARSVWAYVRGPGAAFVASAARLGWTVHDACSVTLDDGFSVHFTVDSPAMVKELVASSVQRWRWRAVEERYSSLHSGGRGDGALIQPILQLLRPCRSKADEWGPSQRAGLKSAVLNRQWPQARLFAAGLADAPQCRLCLAEAQETHGDCCIELSALPVGSLGHRVYAW
jgi:hypothetical protein